MSKEDRDGFDKMVADGNAQHCPNCYLLVEKSGGCDKMTCSDCGFKFCLKCGDHMDVNYVTNHLFAIRGGASNDDLICRKTAVAKAFQREEPYLDEVMRAYQGGSRLVMRDVDSVARKMPWGQIPVPLQQLLRSERDRGRIQENVDALLAAQMMANDIEMMVNDHPPAPDGQDWDEDSSDDDEDSDDDSDDDDDLLEEVD